MSEKLPSPRLELRWEPLKDHRHYDWVCKYSLVIPLRESDLRREDKNGNKVRSEMTIPIGETGSGMGEYTPISVLENGYRHVHEPFRDGVHSQWDNDALGGHLPIVAICGDDWRLIPRRVNSDANQN